MHRSIRRLAPETASRIAAGEVIERPLAALKELLDNALDAGARSIEIRVDGSLDRSFSVADDGSGIAADELPIALERHATSKLDDLADLERIETLGFRGEALPSIAAVSRMRIVSRATDAPAAAVIEVEAGTISERGAAGRATGTTVAVSALFFNTPARRKFLSSPTGELRAAARLLECYGLAFPEVAFRLVVDGRARLDWAGAVTHPDDPLAARRERAVAVWGTRHGSQLIEARGERGGVVVEALLGLPEHSRATREGQIFLVNRRWIHSPSLSYAVRQAYGNLLPAGRFPAATVWLTVPPDRLDVNVHPTKREVRFADDSMVFALVAATCARPLTSLHPPFTVVPGGTPESAANPDSWTAGGEQTGLAFGSLSRSATATLYEAPAFAPADTVAEHPSAAEEPHAVPPAGATAAPTAPGAAVEESELWQLHRTYILAPVRGALVIIDQHAAHERILYEEARARLEGRVGTSQQLLFPTLVDLSPSQFDLVLELGPWLQQLGWDLSPLGPPTVVVRGMPPEIRTEQPARFLQDLLDGMGESTGQTGDQDVAERLSRTYACHAAVRAGDALSSAEMRALVDRLFATSKPHGDPHGRPTYVRFGLEELHRRFGRS